MIEMLETHTALVVSGAEHQASCTCGWAGLRRTLQSEAEVDALIHELESPKLVDCGRYGVIEQHADGSYYWRKP